MKKTRTLALPPVVTLALAAAAGILPLQTVLIATVWTSSCLGTIAVVTTVIL